MNTPRKSPGNEEPDLGAEESVPLDKRDSDGEQMIEELGRDLEKRGARGGPKPAPE